MQNLAKQLVEMVQSLAAQDFSAMPGPKFLGAFRRELIVRGFSASLAEKIASKIKVSLPAGCLEDEDLQAIAVSYAGIVFNLESAFRAQGFTDTTSALLEAASGMTLSMS